MTIESERGEETKEKRKNREEARPKKGRVNQVSTVLPPYEKFVLQPSQTQTQILDGVEALFGLCPLKPHGFVVFLLVYHRVILMVFNTNALKF